MALNNSPFAFVAFSAVLILFLASPVAAFGAGNIGKCRLKYCQKKSLSSPWLIHVPASIARIEGQNWRHGDIEDTLLNLLMSRAAGGRNFGKLDVKRVYFGNWLRDYSQVSRDRDGEW